MFSNDVISVQNYCENFNAALNTSTVLCLLNHCANAFAGIGLACKKPC
jgi:hypothetical protein